MDDDFEHQRDCHELHRDIVDVLANTVHPNDMILKLLIAVQPLHIRQRLLELISVPVEDGVSPLKDQTSYVKALEIVSEVCKKSTYP